MRYYKSKTVRLFSLLICFSLLFNACKNENSKEQKEVSPYFSSLFLPNEATVFRKATFNLSAEEVKNIEQAKLYESAPDHLFYEFSFPKDSTAFSEYANVQYFFNENNQLDIITTDIFLTDSVQENQLKLTLNDYYNEKYGDAEMDDYNESVWKTSSKDKKTEKQVRYHISVKKIQDEIGISAEFVRE